MQTLSCLRFSPSSTGWLLLCVATFLVWPLPSLGQEACNRCVEDVVAATHDGCWIAGYIYWNQPPFRYLDLTEAAGRGAFASGRGNRGALRLWPHAISIARSRFPQHLGDAPAASVPDDPSIRVADEIALLIGEPIEVPVDSVERIYPRIGSGLPAVEISRQQLHELAEQDLPFHSRRGGECMGCPMSVEDTTLVLQSGELVSGLLSWHGASVGLNGFDLRDPEARRAHRRLFSGWGEELALWTKSVSGPRRTFRGAASHGFNGELFPGRSFFALGGTALLTGAAEIYALEEVAFLLPGPSRAASPLLIDRDSALRLLHQPPVLAMASYWDSFSAYCFSYEAGQPLENFGQVCRQALVDTSNSPDPSPAVGVQVVQTPGTRRTPAEAPKDSRFLLLYFDAGT
ncbi:MAG: hypothetical protein AAF657_19355 [Acidobacteriota bacterium]